MSLWSVVACAVIAFVSLGSAVITTAAVVVVYGMRVGGGVVGSGRVVVKFVMTTGAVVSFKEGCIPVVVVSKARR